MQNSTKFNKLNVISCNVRGLANKVKRIKVYRYLHDHDVDIACLQETHCTKNKQHFWTKEWGGKAIYSQGESNARGVSILFKPGLEIENLKQEKDSMGRVITAGFNIHDISYRIVNVYAPNEPHELNPEFFASLLDSIQLYTEDHVIMTGDFNQVLDNDLDRKGGKKENLMKSAEMINEFLEQSEWNDVWRVLNKSFQFTWKRNNPLIMRRLDYFFVPLGNFSLVTQCKIYPATFSDHCPIFMQLSLTDRVRGPGL